MGFLPVINHNLFPEAMPRNRRQHARCIQKHRLLLEHSLYSDDEYYWNCPVHQLDTIKTTRCATIPETPDSVQMASTSSVSVPNFDLIGHWPPLVASQDARLKLKVSKAACIQLPVKKSGKDNLWGLACVRHKKWKGWLINVRSNQCCLYQLCDSLQSSH